MIGIVIVTHRRLGRELLDSLIYVVGQQPAVCAVDFEANSDRETKTREVCGAVKSVDKGCGVIVVTDIIGSSPWYTASQACNSGNIRVLTGANLPMLIKLVKCRERKIEVAASLAVKAGRKYISQYNREGRIVESSPDF